MKKRIYANSLLFKIVLVVMAGIISFAILLSVMNIATAKQVFLNNYEELQRKIFHQIDSEFYKFNTDMAEIMGMIGTSQNLQVYFMEEQTDTILEMQNQYSIDRQFERSKIVEYDQIRVCILNKNGKSYIDSNSDMFAASKEEIWKSKAAESAKENLGKIICVYEEQGFTKVTQNSPVMIMAKAWSYQNDGTVDVIAFITIKESDVRKMYSHFTSNSSDIVLLNQDNQVISSNNEKYLNEQDGKVGELENVLHAMTDDEMYKQESIKMSETKMYLLQKLQSSNYKIMGIINPDVAFNESYHIGRVVWPTLFITVTLVILLVLLVRQQTKPLAILAETMYRSKENKFKEHVPIMGTLEVRELSETYNHMVDELDNYIHQLIEVETSKRTAEIYALQMQINPHYMYNTLASVKWIVRQGDVHKSIQVIDAFISLLRNVVSNSDECIRIEQEIENLKNYVLVNQARYGEAIRVEFFVLPQCMQYEIPKLILQPFVENAFFHAFPEGRRGMIQIFVKEEQEMIRFDIVDDGIGMMKEQLRNLHVKKETNTHFTGIGIENVDDRIKMIYGMNYGIAITSEEGRGTRVVLRLPKKMG